MATKKKDEYNDKSKPNIKALTAFLVKGDPIVKGQVVAKTDFSVKSDWQNLCNMEPPRAEETDEDVGVPDEADEPPAPKKKPVRKPVAKKQEAGNDPSGNDDDAGGNAGNMPGT